MAKKRIPRPNNKVLKKEYRKGYIQGYLVALSDLKKIRKKMYESFPICQQALDCVEAGIDVETKVNMSDVLQVIGMINKLD